MNVSVIGLGLMGRPLAERLVERGFDIVGWNRSPLAAAPVPLVESLAEAADRDVVLLMLADSAAVDEVLPRLEERLLPGRVVLDMGSSDPERSREHAARLAGRGIGWVDAPVSGGPEAARDGTLAIMAGGEEADVDRVRPLLEAAGQNVAHVGGPGAGHLAKVANQIIVGLTIEAVAEALALAERLGLEGRLVQEAVRGGSADSRVLQVLGTRMIERRYVPGGKVATMLKDLRLAQQLARSVGLELPHVDDTVARYEALAERGEADLDCTVLHRELLERT